jgi:hypothetical protein
MIDRWSYDDQNIIARGRLLTASFFGNQSDKKGESMAERLLGPKILVNLTWANTFGKPNWQTQHGRFAPVQATIWK